MIRFGSVCSGIEAASVAWSPLGWEPAWFSEIDPFPAAVLGHHYPAITNHGDFTEIHKHVEPGSIDVLVGGTPCQSFSITGLRKGMDDSRGNLALEFLRLAKAIQPTWIVWENVVGVLSSGGGRDFGSFLGALEQLGFRWAYRVLDAQGFGVPQKRRRVYLVGHLGPGANHAALSLFECPFLPAIAPEIGQVREAPAGVRPDGTGQHGLVYGMTGDETPKFLYECLPTIRSSQGGEGIMVSNGKVRRLTVAEIEKAMGFPRDYTKVPYRGRDAESCPERPRVAALGNSMVVPVMAWIGRRIDFLQGVQLP
jgi:DNA (cytosine-5)-methyltransferase 1